jgi:hypothetical protein
MRLKKFHRLHPVVCIISYNYEHHHDNKAEYLWAKIKGDVDMCLTYLI